MISGIGVDIEEIKRFKKISKNFINFAFTKKEIKYCNKKKNKYESFAGKFCAKESVIKAVNERLTVQDIEILNDEDDKIKVYIKGKYKKNIKCSISHTKDIAIAFVTVEN